MNWQLPEFLKGRFGRDHNDEDNAHGNNHPPRMAEVHLQDLGYCVALSHETEPRTVIEIAARWNEMADLMEQGLNITRPLNDNEHRYIESVRNVAQAIESSNIEADKIEVPVQDLDILVNEGNIANRALRNINKQILELKEKAEDNAESPDAIAAAELETVKEPLVAFSRTGRGTLDAYSSNILPLGYIACP